MRLVVLRGVHRIRLPGVLPRARPEGHRSRGASVGHLLPRDRRVGRESGRADTDGRRWREARRSGELDARLS